MNFLASMSADKEKTDADASAEEELGSKHVEKESEMMWSALNQMSDHMSSQVPTKTQSVSYQYDGALLPYRAYRMNPNYSAFIPSLASLTHRYRAPTLFLSHHVFPFHFMFIISLRCL